MKIIFMGTPEFAVPSLEALINSEHEISLVICQPDRPKGRGKKVSYPPVKELALRYSIPVEQPNNIKDDNFHDLISGLSPDMICVVAYGKIIPWNILDVPKYGCVNVHASLLPKYRGAAPINWAIIKGEKITGITTMLMDEGMDTGDILLKAETGISKNITSVELANVLSVQGADLLLRTISKIEEGSIKPQKQDNRKASYAPLLKKEHGIINWAENSEDIRNLVRGIQPWPGAYTKLNNKILKIYTVKISTGTGDPGEVLRSDSGILRIATGNGSVDITKLQLEGSKRMSVGDFLRGRDIEPGTFLGK